MFNTTSPGKNSLKELAKSLMKKRPSGKEPASPGGVAPAPGKADGGFSDVSDDDDDDDEDDKQQKEEKRSLKLKKSKAKMSEGMNAIAVKSAILFDVLALMDIDVSSSSC